MPSFGCRKTAVFGFERDFLVCNFSRPTSWRSRFDQYFSRRQVGQCSGFIRPLPVQNVLAGQAFGSLSASWSLAALGDAGLRGIFAVDFCAGRRVWPPASSPGCGLALVLWNTYPGDRIDSGRSAVNGRSLRLRANHRTFSYDRLGNGRLGAPEKVRDSSERSVEVR